MFDVDLVMCGDLRGVAAARGRVSYRRSLVLSPENAREKKVLCQSTLVLYTVDSAVHNESTENSILSSAVGAVRNRIYAARRSDVRRVSISLLRFTVEI